MRNAVVDKKTTAKRMFEGLASKKSEIFSKTSIVQNKRTGRCLDSIKIARPDFMTTQLVWGTSVTNLFV